MVEGAAHEVGPAARGRRVFLAVRTLDVAGRTPGLELLLAAHLAVSIVLSVALAAPRAYSMRLWRDADGVLLRRGTALTLGWWVGLFALRFGLTFAEGLVFPAYAHALSALVGASTLLTVGISLLAQAWFLERRLQGAGLRTVAVLR